MIKHLARILGVALAVFGAGFAMADGDHLKQVLPLPAGYFTTGMSCTRGSLVVFGHVRELLSTTPEVRILRLAKGTPEWEVAYSQPMSRVLADSIAGDGTLTAIVGASDKHAMIRSLDGGTSWAAIEGAPAGVFGVSFRNALVGYAWNDDVLHFTSDGGHTWRAVPTHGIISPGMPVPVADENGRLWVVQRRTKGPISRLVTFGPDLSIERDLDSSDWIAAVATSGKDVWFALQRGGYGKVVISRLQRDGGQPEGSIVAELNEDLPIDFSVRGENVALILSDTSKGGSSRYVTTSKDGGRSWKRLSLDHDTAEHICVGQGGKLWVAGSTGLWAVGD